MVASDNKISDLLFVYFSGDWTVDGEHSLGYRKAVKGPFSVNVRLLAPASTTPSYGIRIASA